MQTGIRFSSSAKRNEFSECLIEKYGKIIWEVQLNIDNDTPTLWITNADGICYDIPLSELFDKVLPEHYKGKTNGC